MAIFNDDLIVFHDDNSVFSDKSFEANEYIRDSFALELDSSDDYLYLGLYKPFDRVYVEMATAATSANTFTAEYYNGTAFTAISEFVDESKGFTRSGFIKWKRDQTDQAKTTINSEELYWIRLRPSVTHDVGTIIQGLNIVFADDNDLLGEMRTLTKYLASGDTTFITYHESARKQIVQSIRNRGSRKKSLTINKNITKWDILDAGEISEAAKHLALSKIFFAISDNPEDKWYQRYLDNRRMYEAAFNLFYLTLDTDDDGVVDGAERLGIRRIQVNRV
jgi:hypothetical protein